MLIQNRLQQNAVTINTDFYNIEKLHLAMQKVLLLLVFELQ